MKEIARRTLEQCKRREAEATDRAEKLHEELCALKVALKEARDACDAAVGASDGAFRQLARREDRNPRRRVRGVVQARQDEGEGRVDDARIVEGVGAARVGRLRRTDGRVIESFEQYGAFALDVV